MESQQLLPGEPSSVAKARRFVEETLASWRQADMADVAALVVSELVTNAVLHTGSDVVLRLVLARSALRVEVRDGSPVLPSDPDYGADAFTGRGLHLVTLLAESWGAEPLPASGKVVWCLLALPGKGDDEEPEEPVARPTQRSAPGTVASPGLLVELPGVPLRLYRAVQQHNDALLREAALMAIGDPVAASVSGVALSTQAAINAALAPVVDAALGAGETSADLTATVPLASGEAAADLNAALRDADGLARQGVLLTPGALPELRACREWLLEQIVAQQEGYDPAPWSAAPVLDRVGDALLAEVEQGEILDSLSDAVLIGDEENRIVFASSAVEELLGWPAKELVGRRLTTVVPERLREAHVAGFSRYLVTGESRMMGFPVRVPALHRDGSEVSVELTLNDVRAGGRQLFVGALRAITEPDVSGRNASVRDAVGALEAVVAVLAGESAPLDEVGGVLLRTIAGELGWHFGALWQMTDEWLTVTHVWQDGDFSEFADTSLRHRFPSGAGLPGRVWASGELAWLSDVVADANFPRAHTALMCGLRSAFAVPLRGSDGQPLAVAEFYTVETIDPDREFLAVLETIGVVVGALLERS